MNSRKFPPVPTMTAIKAVCVSSRPDALGRAMVLLFARQTPDEKSRHATWYSNDRGFNQWTAKRGSLIAEKHARGQALTPDEITFAVKIADVHRRQLLQEAWRKWWNDADVMPGDLLELAAGFVQNGQRVTGGQNVIYLGIQDEPGVMKEPLITFVDTKGRTFRVTPSELFNKLANVTIGR